MMVRFIESHNINTIIRAFCDGIRAGTAYRHLFQDKKKLSLMNHLCSRSWKGLPAASRGTGGKLVGGASWCLRHKITMRDRKTV